MDVLAYLSPPLLAQFRRVTDTQHSLATAEGWDDVERQIRRRVVDVVVLDPAADGVLRTGEILSLVARYPTQSIVLYLVLSPPSLRAVVELAKQGITQVVLHRFDDDVGRFRAMLARQHGSGLADRVLAELAGAIATLPNPLGGAVRLLFQRPNRFWHAQDLATAAGMPRRTMYRELEAAGFASPRLLVQAARLLRAFSYLQEPGYRVTDVVEKLGYRSSRVLVRHARELTGVTPSELRGGMSGEEFAARLLAGIRGEPPLPPPSATRRRLVRRPPSHND